MKHEIHLNEGLVFVRVSEAATAEGFAAVARAIVELPGWEPGMNILADYADLDLSHVTQHDVRTFAQMFSSHREKLGNGLCACVNANLANFGLGRMWQVFMQDCSDLQVNVFYNVDQAKCWLFGE